MKIERNVPIDTIEGIGRSRSSPYWKIEDDFLLSNDETWKISELEKNQTIALVRHIRDNRSMEIRCGVRGKNVFLLRLKKREVEEEK